MGHSVSVVGGSSPTYIFDYCGQCGQWNSVILHMCVIHGIILSQTIGERERYLYRYRWSERVRERERREIKRKEGERESWKERQNDN